MTIITETTPVPPKPHPKLCQICFLQGIKYTCPTCFLKYCSLKCFKSPKHSDCLEEKFYKSQVENMLKERVVGDEERKEMVKVLKRMMEEDEEFDIADLSLGLDDAIAYTDANANTDANTDNWKEDTKAREKFDTLVGSGQFGVLIDLWKPWWSLPSPSLVPTCKLIPTIHIPEPHPDLYYTLIDFIFVYVVSIRTLNGEEDKQELVEIVLSISQVLSQSPNCFTFKSVHEVVELVRHNFLASKMKFNQDSLPIFLNDVVEILSRKEWVLVVLSELSKWMRKKTFVRKLEYFMVLIDKMDETVLELLRVGIRQEAMLLARNDDAGSTAKFTNDLGNRPLIQEI